MDLEGSLEFSLGCLPLVTNPNGRGKLHFPLILQVLDTRECRSRVWSHLGRSVDLRERLQQPELRRILTVSDGFYRKVDCFLLSTNQAVEPFSIVKVHNIDFECNIERQKELPRIVGMILEFEVLKKGSEIGYVSGKPVAYQSRSVSPPNLRLHLVQYGDILSSKLWKQVKEERCCDVVFSFPKQVGVVVKAQKSALVANSPVFEAQLEGRFTDATSDQIPVEDTEPKYMRGLLQFVFTRFVPLLGLTHAFQLLYLARKYLISDLEQFCKNFILNNKQCVAGVPDVFLHLQMNEKSCDDDISQFVWNQFKQRANVLIRLPMFCQISFRTLESFLSEPELNCHEWELALAVRRWVVANNRPVTCHLEHQDIGTRDEDCAHQLIEAIRWTNMPVKEAVKVASWPELCLHRDQTFLTDLLDEQQGREGRAISHTEVVPTSVNMQYSLNRIYHDDGNFVIYTNLAVDPVSMKVHCLHGHKVSESTFQQTKCETVGPPFELVSFYIVPSYGLASQANNKVKLTVNLSCQGKSFTADRFDLWVKSVVQVTVFSFSPTHSAKELRKEVNFWPDRDSSNSCTIVFNNIAELQPYLHSVTDHQGKVRQELDIQLQFDMESVAGSGRGRVSPPRIMRPLRTSAPRIPAVRHRTTYDHRIDDGGSYSSVGRTVSFLRSREGRSSRGGRLEHPDGWGDLNRSPQSRRSPEYREYREEPPRSFFWSPTYSPPPGPLDDTIELDSPEYDQSAAYGDITRSPQSPYSVSSDPRVTRDFGDRDVEGQDPLFNSRSPSPSYRTLSPCPSPSRYSSRYSRSPSPQPGPSHYSPIPQPAPSHYSTSRPTQTGSRRKTTRRTRRSASVSSSPGRSPRQKLRGLSRETSPDLEYRPDSPSYDADSPAPPVVIDIDVEDREIQMIEVVEADDASSASGYVADEVVPENQVGENIQEMEKSDSEDSDISGFLTGPVAYQLDKSDEGEDL